MHFLRGPGPLGGCDVMPNVTFIRAGRSAASLVEELERLEVGHHLLGLAERGAGPAPDGRYGVDERDELRHIVAIGAGERCGQRRVVGVDHEVVFGTGFPAVHGARSRFFPPCTARTEAESTTTRAKSIPPAARSSASSSSCSRCHTPALRHSSRRFHRVMPQQPISHGKSSHGMPVLRTNKIPVKQTRSGTRGFPPLRLGGCFGSRGSMRLHRSSGDQRLRHRVLLDGNDRHRGPAADEEEPQFLEALSLQ